jgi:adenylate cyclase
MRGGLLSRCRRCASGFAVWAGRIGAVYLMVHVRLAAAIPAFYSVFTVVNTALFAWTRNLPFYRFTQLLLILILPWLVTIALGGFRQSSVVIIWAALCPVGSLVLEELRRTLLWILGLARC